MNNNDVLGFDFLDPPSEQQILEVRSNLYYYILIFCCICECVFSFFLFFFFSFYLFFFSWSICRLFNLSHYLHICLISFHFSVFQALTVLHMLGAIDSFGAITVLGEEMSKLPLEPFLSRMLIESSQMYVRT